MRPDEEELPPYSGDVKFGAAGDEGGRAVAAAVERESCCISSGSVARLLGTTLLKKEGLRKVFR